MIISNTHKYIFVHIHKTAGTAISRALDPHLTWNDVLLGSTDYGEAIQPHYKKRFGLNKHSSAAEIRAVVGEETWNSYYRFSSVRHPVTRIESLYAYLGTHYERRSKKKLFGLIPIRPKHMPPWSWREMQIFRETSSISAFLRHPDFFTTDGAKPQVDKLCDASGALMVHDVIKLEELAVKFPAVAARLGVPEATLGHANRSKEKNRAKAVLSLADRELVREVYRRDYEMFGYD